MRHIRLLIASIPLIMLLGLAAAGVATAGGGCHQVDQAVATEASSTVVKIDGCSFAPTITRVPVGTEVTFLNSSPTYHDVTGRSNAWASAVLESGASYAHRFDAAGAYPYSCSLHPGMAGVVVVGGSDVGLVSDVQAAPTEPTPTGAASVDMTLPVVAAGGLGVLAGALVAGSLVSRRQRPI
jgi:plastocyanin